MLHPLYIALHAPHTPIYSALPYLSQYSIASVYSDSAIQWTASVVVLVYWAGCLLVPNMAMKTSPEPHHYGSATSRKHWPGVDPVCSYPLSFWMSTPVGESPHKSIKLSSTNTFTKASWYLNEVDKKSATHIHVVFSGKNKKKFLLIPFFL